MKDWTMALEWTGREPWGLDRTVLVVQVFTDSRRRVVAHDTRTVDTAVGTAPQNDRWLQILVRQAQVNALREKVLPYLSRHETALYRRYQVVRAVGNDDDDDDNDAFFTSEDWSTAAFDAHRLLRCKPWHPHLMVWVWCEIIGGDDGNGEEEPDAAPEVDDEGDTEEEEEEEEEEVNPPATEHGQARMYRRCARTLRARRASPPPSVFSLTMRRRHPLSRRAEM